MSSLSTTRRCWVVLILGRAVLIIHVSESFSCSPLILTVRSRSRSLRCFSYDATVPLHGRKTFFQSCCAPTKHELPQHFPARLQYEPTEKTSKNNNDERRSTPAKRACTGGGWQQHYYTFARDCVDPTRRSQRRSR